MPRFDTASCYIGAVLYRALHDACSTAVRHNTGPVGHCLRIAQRKVDEAVHCVLYMQRMLTCTPYHVMSIVMAPSKRYVSSMQQKPFSV
eukprot:5573-Heterococcus_DN1.PRE.2